MAPKVQQLPSSAPLPLCRLPPPAGALASLDRRQAACATLRFAVLHCYRLSRELPHLRHNLDEGHRTVNNLANAEQLRQLLQRQNIVV